MGTMNGRRWGCCYIQRGGIVHALLLLLLLAAAAIFLPLSVLGEETTSSIYIEQEIVKGRGDSSIQKLQQQLQQLQEEQLQEREQEVQQEEEEQQQQEEEEQQQQDEEEEQQQQQQQQQKVQSAVVPGKEEVVKKILSHPPAGFAELANALSFTIYGKDKRGNYVAFCDSSRIDWPVVESFSEEALSAFVFFYALFFWVNVDRRADSSLTVVVDAGGFSFRKVVGGSARRVLNSLVGGLNKTVRYIGERPGCVFLLNTSSFLGPLISLISSIVNTGVIIQSYSKRSQWENVLKEHIGEEYLPREYGGTNSVPLADALASKYILQSVGRTSTKRRTQ